MNLSEAGRLDTLTQRILDEHIRAARTAVGQAFSLGYEVGEHSRPAPRCVFFDDSTEHPGIVVQEVGHPFAVEGVHFFVPVEGGGAVRVPVCEAHLEHLKRVYGSEDKT